MDPFVNDPASNHYYHVPTSAHSTDGHGRSSSPPRDQRSYTPYSSPFPARGVPYPFCGGLPGTYPPHHKGDSQMVETQYQSYSSSRPPDHLHVSHSVEVTRAGPAQALSSIVPSPTSQIITSHHIDRSESVTPGASSSGSLRHFPNAKPNKPRSGSSRGSPRATPSLIKAEAPTTLGASMSGSDCFSTAEEPVPYALTNHPIFSEDLKKACTPIRKVENPFATQNKSSNVQSVYGEYEIQRYKNDMASKFEDSHHSSTKVGIQLYPNGVRNMPKARIDYSASSSSHDKQGGALDLSIKTVRQSADSTAPELDSSFSNSALYLGKTAYEPAKQTMPYDYSYRNSATKRQADEYDPNVLRNKYLKARSSPNHALPRQAEASRGSHVASRFGSGKVSEHCDLRSIYDGSSFAQAHTSLTMPYGRQVQSANSSGYFSEGLSEPGVSFTPPVSPRVKPSPKLQEKDRTDIKAMDIEGYYRHARPIIKNSPYNAYSGQPPNVYDRGRNEEAMKINSQSAFSNSNHAYYQSFTPDRYHSGNFGQDNSNAFMQSTYNYGKTTESSIAGRRSYDSYLKNANPELPLINPNPIYPQYSKHEVAIRLESKRQPKIEIASQPINLVEDNEISIEKTQNNTLSFENFSPKKTFKNEISPFQDNLESREVKSYSNEVRDIAICAKVTSNTPLNKIESSKRSLDQIVGSHVEQDKTKFLECESKETALNSNKLSGHEPGVCDASKDSRHKSAQNSNDTDINSKQADSKDSSTSEENCSDSQNLMDKKENDKTEGNGISVSHDGIPQALTVSKNCINGEKSSQELSSTEIKLSCSVLKINSTNTEVLKENIPSLPPKDVTIEAKFKQEKREIKCELGHGVSENIRNDTANTKQPEIDAFSISKKNFSNTSNLKEYSAPKFMAGMANKNDLNSTNETLQDASSSKYKKSEIVQPVLNLSLSTNQVGMLSQKSTEDIPQKIDSPVRELYRPSDKMYQNAPINNYYDSKLQQIANVQQNNSYSQRSNNGQPVPQNSQIALDKPKYNHSTFHKDAVTSNLKQGMHSSNKDFYQLQPAIKSESYSNLMKLNPTQGYSSHGFTKNEYSANPEAIVTSSNQFNRTAKDANLSYSVVDSVSDKAASSKHIPLAINPRVLSPWNSSVPHSLPQSNRKPPFMNASQLLNDFSKEANPLVKEIGESEKKQRLTPISTYHHDTYASQYPYLPTETSRNSTFSLNTQPERSQSYGYDSKTNTYTPPAGGYMIDSHNYEPYTSAATLSNVPSSSHQFNSSSTSGSRPLLSPHSPPHPPPPRHESSHHQSLYYPSTINASVSPRTIGEQYSRGSPHYSLPVDAAKYPSREYTSYAYKGSYGQQGNPEGIPYTNTAPYYSQNPYNAVSSSQSGHQDFTKSTRFDYHGEQQGYAKFATEPNYLPDRPTYPHPSAYSYSASLASKEFPSNKSPHPPTAHLSQPTVEYKPPSYDAIQQMHSSSHSSMPYINQYSDHKGYLLSSKDSSQSNQMSSYPYSTPKSIYPSLEDQFDSSVIRAEPEAGQYSMQNYPRSYVRSSMSANNKPQYSALNQNIHFCEPTIPKTQNSTSRGELELQIEKPNTTTAVKSNISHSVMGLKDNIGKTISNAAHPLYSSWPNFRTPHPDTILGKQMLKPQSQRISPNVLQKYPSFKTEKMPTNQQSKVIPTATPLTGGSVSSSVSSNRKDISLKEQIPFSRQETYLKGPFQKRSSLLKDLNQKTQSKENKLSENLESSSADLDFDNAMNVFEADLGTNREGMTSKKSLILAKRYSHRVELQKSAIASGVVEEEVQSFDESESDSEPPCKFRGKYKTIKGKKAERLVLTYASHSDESATEMIADEDESDFEEQLLKEIEAKSRKGRGKDKESKFKETPDDSDASSADRNTRSSKHKTDAGRQRKGLSSTNSTDTSSDSSEESNSSDSCESLKSRPKKGHSDDSSSDCDARKTRSSRSKGDDSKKLNTNSGEKLKRITRRCLRKTVHCLSELSEDEVKPKRLRSMAKDYLSNSEENDTMASSSDSETGNGKEKGRRLVLESDSENDSVKSSNASDTKDQTKDVPLILDPILKKLEHERKQESDRADVREMKAWKQKTCEQAKTLLKSLPAIPVKHSWRRPLFSGVFKKGWQKELRKFKLQTVRTPKQLVSIPPTPGNVDRKRGRRVAKGRSQSKDLRDGLYSRIMMRRFFEKVLIHKKEDESLSRSSSSPFSTFTPTGLTPTPSVTPSMLVTGIGSGDSDKDSLISLRGASPPASDSATLRRRSIATTIIQKIQRHHYKSRGLEAPWLNKPRPTLKTKTRSVLPLPRSLSSDVASESKNKKVLDVAFIRSIFGDDPPPNLKFPSEGRLNSSVKRKNYISPLSSSTHSTSSTPSTPIDVDEVGGVVASRKRKLKKFRSGFDYIPKRKKKLKPLEEVVSRARKKVAARRRRVWPESSRDVATEVKTWVINKGLGETVLHRAARLQYHDVVIYCLESKEINVNARDNAGYTPLHEACNRGHLDVAQALCAYGAHVNAPGYGGMRPLHEACDNGHLQLVRLLLSFGADINLASYAGQSCISLASDSLCGPFVLDFINDLRGKKAKPWMFDGPARLFDGKEQWADLFADTSQLNDSQQSDDSFIFESSDCLLPFIYIIDGYPDSFVLLNELLDNLKCSYDDLVKEAGQIETVHLSRKEFKKKTYCSSVTSEDQSYIKTGMEIVLVKYTKRLQNLLGVEVLTIT